jgi:tripartite-type tricarboxylate transporter receptor subunit TctC
MRRIATVVLAVLGLFVFAAPAAAAYPDRNVTIVVPYPAGGPTDQLARVMAEKLSKKFGQNFIVENVTGGSTIIASNKVAKADPDGYTLLINSAAHAVNPAIFAKLPYDTVKDFTDIAALAVQPNVLVVAANSPYKTLGDLLAYAKANPGKLNFGHAGVGSGTHLNTEKLLSQAGITAVVVPFKGTPEVVAAILSGSVDCYWVPISAGLSNIRGGKLHPLAVSTAKRNPQLPDVPTTAEAGVKNTETALWFGLWGPAGMSKDLVARINADVRKAVADPGVREKLINLGNDTIDMSVEQFAAFVREEIDTNKRVLSAAGVKPQ